MAIQDGLGAPLDRPVDGVVLVLLDHVVGDDRPGVDGIQRDVVVLTPMLIVMDMEVVLVVALTVVPAHRRAAPVPSVLDAERQWPGR